jgi:nucleoside-diphosphate-sugar epimerase
VRQLAVSGERVVSIDVTPADALLHRFLGDSAANVRFITGDICDGELLSRVARDYAVDRIVHAAVITAVNPTIEPRDPARTIDANIVGTVRVLELTRSLPNLQRVVYVSSSGVYGTTKRLDISIDEEYPVDLPTLYAITKYASEQIVRRYGEMYSFSAATVRIGAPYGPMDHQTWARNERNVICDVIDHALRHEPIVLTREGFVFARDWTRVDDIARGIHQVLSAPSLRHGLYNLSCGESDTIGHIIKMTRECVPDTTYRLTDDVSEVNINLISGKPRGPLDIRRIREDVGFAPSTDLRHGIRWFIDWWRTNHMLHR